MWKHEGRLEQHEATLRGEAPMWKHEGRFKQHEATRRGEAPKWKHKGRLEQQEAHVARRGTHVEARGSLRAA